MVFTLMTHSNSILSSFYVYQLICAVLQLASSLGYLVLVQDNGVAPTILVVDRGNTPYGRFQKHYLHAYLNPVQAIAFSGTHQTYK